jgi:ferrous iron transport protein B
LAGKEITIALAGNPNSGKTTVFNNLTGTRQQVGNWPGVTVEKKEGRHNCQGYCIRMVDLPGVYSLTAYAPDEVIARSFVVDEKPDAVVNVVDASNLERNLYLTVQLLEMGAPLIIALNMTDMAEAKGHIIDIESLAQETGAPVVPMVASRNQGIDRLIQEIIRVAEGHTRGNQFKLFYGEEIENEIAGLEEAITESRLAERYPTRWLAIKLLEDDAEIIKKFQGVEVCPTKKS